MSASIFISFYPLGSSSEMLDTQTKACLSILHQKGLKPSIHSQGCHCSITVVCDGFANQLTDNWVFIDLGLSVDGDYDTVVGAIKACHRAVHSLGCPRMTTEIKISTTPN